MTESLVVRRLGTQEITAAYPIIAQLRTLDMAAFEQAVLRQMSAGYELIGAFEAGKLVGVMGLRPVHTLARGAFLHVDDLVVDAACRGRGIGRALMAHAHEEAVARGMGDVFLDSRDTAVPFYEQLGFTLHQSPSMRFRVG
ncbi:GNAT family N-acetyltransferase [Acetobacter suratthaniensis]|uniref:GNAT family N-acetyltransferase n=1 Tax=Acetobacter suratthaniensis TaxID=1502841 RepID=A0ABS3LMK7_9PROT|nr:GNAT family N-acetyltransferase [Acetobacter suratthaniensis]MBO1328594.1 GNAT family N-acetyltransferase [Acetobacter suratthaniensis]MCX2566735.1 GNAT family N-acetyltransferase [Acetobacter suratthaniensis]